MTKLVPSSIALALALIVGAPLEARAQDRAPARRTQPGDRASEERAARARGIVLHSRVTVHFQRLSLDECLEFLHETTGLDVAVTAEAREVAAGRLVSLRLRNVTVRSCLELLLGQVSEDLRWSVRHGVLRIGVAEPEREAQHLVVYDVADLTDRRPDHPAPEGGLAALSYGAGAVAGFFSCFCD